MSAIAYWKIRERLLRVPGIATVDIYGERLKQRHVQVDPALMAKYKIPIDEVMQAGSEALDSGVLAYAQSFTVGQGGFIEQPTQRLNIQDIQTISNAEELAEVVVAKRDGRQLRMKDIGEVLQASQQLWGEAVIDGGDGLLLVVNKSRGANTKEVTEEAEEVLKDMQPGLPGIEIDPQIFRPATFVDQSIDNLTKALLLGMLLVIVIITAFLFTIRTAIISLVAIPLSLMSAIWFLDLRDASINVMVLAGLVVAIGVVVDDAIIDVENIVRRLRESRAAGAETSDDPHDPGRLGGGPQRDHVRDADQHHRRHAGAVPDRTVRRVLPAHGAQLLAGRVHLDDRGDDRDSGHVPRAHEHPRPQLTAPRRCWSSSRSTTAGPCPPRSSGRRRRSLRR